MVMLANNKSRKDTNGNSQFALKLFPFGDPNSETLVHKQVLQEVKAHAVIEPHENVLKLHEYKLNTSIRNSEQDYPEPDNA